ncbi:MAG: YceD family protein [Bacteroidales bacterium]
MERKVLNRYVIQFKGLKTGSHNFQFAVDDAFFNEFDKSLIPGGELTADIEFIKHSSMLELKFKIHGTVDVPCDRCLEVFTVPTSFEGEVIVKISNSIPEEFTDDVWHIDSNEHEINLAQYIYESICLSVPIKRYHGMLGTSTAECDQEMLNELDKLSPEASAEEESETNNDSRWDKLKDLLKN